MPLGGIAGFSVGVLSGQVDAWGEVFLPQVDFFSWTGLVMVIKSYIVNGYLNRSVFWPGCAVAGVAVGERFCEGIAIGQSLFICPFPRLQSGK
jgi:hypothetical protein